MVKEFNSLDKWNYMQHEVHNEFLLIRGKEW